MHSDDVASARGSDHHVGVAAAYVDTQDSVVSATDAFLSTIGLDADDVVGRSLQEIFPSAALARIRHGLQQMLEGGKEIVLHDVECISPNLLILDIELCRASGESAQLRLIETARTRQTLDQAVSSLFQPTDLRSPSFIYISEVATGRVRTLRNNLSASLGLGNCFTHDEFRAVSHPDDIRRDAAYLNERLRLSDEECITFDQRMRTLAGHWQPVAARSRVVARDPDGMPCNMLGVVFDAGDYHSTRDALTEATAALIQAEKTERENIGRNLHDSLSQLLVAAKWTASSLQTDESISQAAAERLEELGALIGAALDEIRAFSFLLHPPGLDELGLSDAVAQLCRGLSWRFNMPIVFEADPAIPRIDEEVEFALFRMVQEALLNAHRHAQAKEIRVSCKRSEGMLELAVRDDGIGLKRPPGTVLAEGVGLSGMRARIAQAGGSLTIEDADPGLRIVASVALGPVSELLRSTEQRNTVRRKA